VKIRVYYEDTDTGGIVYHSKYLNFCKRARSELFFQRGIMPGEGSSNGFVVQEQRRVRAVVRFVLIPRRSASIVAERPEEAAGRADLQTLPCLQAIIAVRIQQSRRAGAGIELKNMSLLLKFSVERLEQGNVEPHDSIGTQDIVRLPQFGRCGAPATHTPAPARRGTGRRPW